MKNVLFYYLLLLSVRDSIETCCRLCQLNTYRCTVSVFDLSGKASGVGGAGIPVKRSYCEQTWLKLAAEAAGGACHILRVCGFGVRTTV
jgi:hypothetical protein